LVFSELLLHFSAGGFDDTLKMEAIGVDSAPIERQE